MVNSCKNVLELADVNSWNYPSWRLTRLVETYGGPKPAKHRSVQHRSADDVLHALFEDLSPKQPRPSLEYLVVGNTTLGRVAEASDRRWMPAQLDSKNYFFPTLSQMKFDMTHDMFSSPSTVRRLRSTSLDIDGYEQVEVEADIDHRDRLLKMSQHKTYVDRAAIGRRLITLEVTVEYEFDVPFEFELPSELQVERTDGFSLDDARDIAYCLGLGWGN